LGSNLQGCAGYHKNNADGLNQTNEMHPVYLDHAATTPVRPEVRDAMLPYLSDRFGNPSSLHRWGQEARAQLEGARSRLARLIGATPAEIVFTRGGTEADNLAILGRSRELRGAPVVCSALEHRAVLAAAEAAAEEGSPLKVLDPTPEGLVPVSAVAASLEPTPAVVSVMWVNNEIGTVQPVPEMARLCAEAGTAFHTDAVQALGKLRIRLDEVPVALVSLSAHKVGGPKGTGALFVRRGVKLRPLHFGGGHERGIRSGTQDVAGAVGFALAAELAEQEREALVARLGALRDRLEAGLRERVDGLTVNGLSSPRVASISSVSVPGTSSETLLLTLDMEGIAVSSGSACSSGAVKPSHVLTALGLPAEVAGPSVRFSLGRETTDEDVNRVLEVFPGLVARLRQMA
jgi:cysteine desulfurase